MERIFGKDFGLPLVTHVGTIQSHSAKPVTWHSHQGCELIFVLAGATAYEVRNHQTVEIAGGHFVIIPSGTVHRGSNDVRQPSTICGLLLDPDRAGIWKNTPFTKQEMRWLGAHFNKAALAPQPFSRNLRQNVTWLMEKKLAWQANQGDPIYKASLRILACAAIHGAACELLTPRPPKSEELIVAAQHYLQQHLDDCIKIDDMVKHIGLGRSRMFAMFKSATGMTPNDYLLRLRIKKAEELLITADLSLTSIAFECGFSSSQYFSKVFRQYAGRTASEFRNDVLSSKNNSSRRRVRQGMARPKDAGPSRPKSDPVCAGSRAHGGRR